MNIVLQGKENIYLQIVNYYKKYIDLNIIKNGDKLPSCRGLAIELGINPNTVVKAYNILESEGYIKILNKKGVYVIKEVDYEINLYEVIKVIQELKNKNIEYQELINIINDIYGKE